MPIQTLLNLKDIPLDLRIRVTIEHKGKELASVERSINDDRLTMKGNRKYILEHDGTNILLDAIDEALKNFDSQANA